MATFNRRSWREGDHPEPLTPIPHPRGDAYYATTSERTDYGLQKQIGLTLSEESMPMYWFLKFYVRGKGKFYIFTVT